MILWGVGVWGLLSPPSSTLAGEADRAPASGIIWPLGRRFRLWNVVSAPVFGLLLGMLSGPSLAMVADVMSGTPPELALDPALLALGVCVPLGTLIAARLPLWGAEIRSERLFVRGVLWTRRYRRSDIVSAHCHEVTGLADWVLGVLLNSPGLVFYVLRMQLKTGRTKTLYASNSSKPDIERAARIVTRWVTGESAVAATVPSAS